MSIPMEAQNVDVAEPQTEDTQVSETEFQNEQPSSKPSAEEQERNWRALERGRDEAERRSRELERQNSEYAAMVKEMAMNNNRPAEPVVDEDDDDIPNLGQTKKTIRREAEKIAKDIVQKTMAEREQNEAPKRLKQEFADFDEIVSKENVDYLIKNEPELATILNETKDNYIKGKVAYKYIKKLGFDKKDSVNAMKQDASRNAAKPVSPNAIAGKNSVGDANMFSRGLTPDLKKQLNQEMIDAIRGY
jgi:hypothetical protein